jgi:hypothetical protein
VESCSLLLRAWWNHAVFYYVHGGIMQSFSMCMVESCSLLVRAWWSVIVHTVFNYIPSPPLSPSPSLLSRDENSSLPSDIC